MRTTVVNKISINKTRSSFSKIIKFSFQEVGKERKSEFEVPFLLNDPDIELYVEQTSLLLAIHHTVMTVST